MLVKLFYQNGSNHLAALREYRRLKDLRKGSTARIGLRKMIMKFEETGNFFGCAARKRTETVEEVATAMVERASSSIYSSASGRSVSRELEISWSTVQKILRYILKWYPYKIHVMQTLKPHDQKTRLEFACRFLVRMEVDDTWPWENSMVIPAFQEQQCLQSTVFMQDGATPHIGRQGKALLSANFGDNRVISRHFPDAWPSCPPALNPCDF
ncbi:uncharacterized protein TNCV_4718321 [Trichonephila clavipes]|nr:uncharacterized protein TNCV_4718321 [Trichonephila clavipes]